MTDHSTPLHFVLVPDTASGRHHRRLLAETGACLGVRVGTWAELTELAVANALLPPPPADWPHRLCTAVACTPGFWSASLAVAEEETLAVVDQSYRALVVAAGPGVENLPAVSAEAMSPRARAHLADLARLFETLDPPWPDDLASLHTLLQTRAEDALRPLRVEVHPEVLANPWQAALIDHLACDSRMGAASVAPRLGVTAEAPAPAGTLLASFQTGLFGRDLAPRPPDDSVQWVGVRDSREAAEVAAGMAQRLLAAEPDLTASDLGLLLPDIPLTVDAVREAFTLAGLPLSGLPETPGMRDLGREVLLHFLYCRRKPAPAMALAACLTSPLMPWDPAIGAGHAQEVMDGNWELRPREDAGPGECALLQLLAEGDEEAVGLASALERFVGLLEDHAIHAEALAEARRRADTLITLLRTQSTPDWRELRRQVAPRALVLEDATCYSREGLAVFRASRHPWRRVRHLLVLDFNENHYPAPVGASPVFAPDDLETLATVSGLPIETPRRVLEARRRLFQLQLAAASTSVTFLVPRRDPFGDALAPSDSLVFMQRLVEGAGSASALVLDLDVAEECARIRHLATCPVEPARPPRVPVYADPQLDRDLLALRMDVAGQPKPESPSSLESLMVSPLGWLLRRTGSEPLAWAPEAPDALLRGNIAHRVFELLFPVGPAIPTSDEVEAQIGSHFATAVREIAPFLQRNTWRVERRHLRGEIREAALVWRTLLAELGATIVGNETWLQGRLDRLPIHGKSDQLLALPDGQLLVVDFKKASSAGRAEAMRAGFDSQVSLYRTMLETGGLKFPDAADPGTVDALATDRPIGVVYYMMNSARALSDTDLAGADRLAHWERIDADPSVNALALLRERLAALRTGTVPLNRIDDVIYYEKTCRIKPYALEISPLIGLFMHPEPRDDGESPE